MGAVEAEVGVEDGGNEWGLNMGKGIAMKRKASEIRDLASWETGEYGPLVWDLGRNHCYHLGIIFRCSDDLVVFLGQRHAILFHPVYQSWKGIKASSFMVMPKPRNASDPNGLFRYLAHQPVSSTSRFPY